MIFFEKNNLIYLLFKSHCTLLHRNDDNFLGIRVPRCAHTVANFHIDQLCHGCLEIKNFEINEADGLSHKVCVKCLGALEFLCDFHDQCHETQEKLAEAKKCHQNSEIPTPLESSYDVDSDKENVMPIIKSGLKRKRQTDPEIKKIEKIQTLISADKCTKINLHESDGSAAEMKPNETEAKKVRKIEETKKCLRSIVKSPNSPENNDSMQAKKINNCPKVSEAETTDYSAIKSPGDKNNPETLKNEKKNIKSPKSKTIPAIVKLEKIENRSVAPTAKNEKILKSNKIVWIPNFLQLPNGESPKSRALEKSHDESPASGDEAEKLDESRGKSEKILKQRPAMEIARKSVIEKFVNTKLMENVASTIDKRRQPRLASKKLKIHENEENQEESNDDDENAETKKMTKITDLITDEQKEAIEKFYTCDMSAVDEQLVGDKLIFLDRKKFGCRLCDASYTRQDKCQVHIWGHLDMRPYRCNACDFSTVTVSNIRCHVRKSHLKIKPYVCEICEKRYVTAFLLEEHMNTHTGLRPYGCDICNFTSASRQVLSYHKTTHKPVKDITCHVCGKEFYSKGRLRAHLIVHNKDKAANMCKLCSIYLCNSEALKRHHVNVHSKDYECNVCGKRCKSKKALNNHQNVHSAAKYKCTLCSNVYKSSHILKEHLLKHEGIRKYKCNKCQKDFAQQSHLAAHMAVHSDKRFFCPGCNRPFNRHDNMKMHTKRCEAFLANPELVALLSVRRRQAKSLENDRGKTIEVRNDVSSVKADYKKTDSDINEEGRAIELLNFPRSNDDSLDNLATIIVESTIPCT